jgi:hypothetical protein
VPFVKFFGIPGMLVVPALSLLMVLLVVGKVGKLLRSKSISLFLVASICGTPTIMRWMLANITDSLLVGLFSIAIYLMLFNNKITWNWYVAIAFIIILAGLTRFCLFFWIAIAVVYLIRKEKITMKEKTLEEMDFQELVEYTYQKIHDALMMGGNAAMKEAVQQSLEATIKWKEIQNKS